MSCIAGTTSDAVYDSKSGLDPSSPRAAAIVAVMKSAVPPIPVCSRDVDEVSPPATGTSCEVTAYGSLAFLVTYHGMF
jgi:hypothetical protein